MFTCNKLVTPEDKVCPPALGSATVSIEGVEKAIDALIKRMAPEFLELVRDTADQLKEECISREWGKGSSLNPEDWFPMPTERYPECKALKIEIHSFEEDEPLKNSRYFLRLDIETANLNPNDGLEHLLIELKNDLNRLGYTDKGVFDVHLNKGCFPKPNRANSWHFDHTFKTAITLCYSTIENWCTQIQPVFNPDGESSRLGLFYNALEVYHRSPNASDLGTQKLKLDDMRMFIRYRELNAERDPIEELTMLPPCNKEQIMNEDISVRKSNIGQFEDGRGVFANRVFKKGEIVIKWNLKTLSQEEFDQLPEYEKNNFCHKREGTWYYYPVPERYVNRSENPNVFPDFEKEANIALRDIEKGEELSILDSTQEDF